jgi:hypothetical protein
MFRRASTACNRIILDSRFSKQPEEDLFAASSSVVYYYNPTYYAGYCGTLLTRIYISFNFEVLIYDFWSEI